MEGSVSDLLERCRTASRKMAEQAGLRGGCATMLFYGPPGTGKTALARYIASELGRKCVTKRASDLMDKYVGENEKNIANAFRSAEREGHVLIIDEVDSFLFPRDVAVRSWEVSMVSEFLTSLEECRAFCICTTNLREKLDSAALRRFSYKVAFSYAGEAQIEALYRKLLSPLCADATEYFPKDVLALSTLTPGDFHAVRQQYDSAFAEGRATHEKLLDALKRELSLKNENLRRPIGFANACVPLQIHRVG